MEDIANLDGIGVSDAMLKAMEDEALLEREEKIRKGLEPPMLPRGVDLAPPLPPAPPFGVPQDFRYQFHSPEPVGGGAQLLDKGQWATSRHLRLIN